MTPVMGAVAQKAFSVVRLGGNAFPQFSGAQGQIDHTGGNRTKAGVDIDEAGALRVAAIWIATTLLADEVSSLVFKLLRRGESTRERVEPSALRALWGEPNSDQTRQGIVATEVLSLTLWGVSYDMLGWTRGGELDVRWPLDPASARLERIDEAGIRLKVTGKGELENRPGVRPQFSYIPLFNLPGRLEPVSPVRAAAEIAGLAAAYDEIASRLAGRGMTPSAILTVGEKVEQPESEELSKRLARLHGGPVNSGGIAVLGGKDIKLERLTMSLADAEFVKQNERIFQILMAIWRVPPTVAGMVDKPSTWGTGVAEFSRGLERFTLRPLVQRLQAGYEKYMTGWVSEDLQARFLFDSLLSSAPKERAEIQRLALMNGMTSVERVLAQNDEAPFDEGETVYTSLALAGAEDRKLERLRKQGEAAAALIRAGVTREDALMTVGLEGVEIAPEPPPVATPPAVTEPPLPEPEAEV